MAAESPLLCYPDLKFDELCSVLDQMKQGTSCLVDLNTLPPDLAQRTVDILAGGCHTLNGHCQDLGEGFFLFSVPSFFEHAA